MINLYLKAADEAELILGLLFARATDENQNEIWVKDTHDYSLVLIGAIYEGTGEYSTDENGHQYELKTAFDGYHANLRLINEDLASSVPESIQIPEPNTPTLIFF